MTGDRRGLAVVVVNYNSEDQIDANLGGSGLERAPALVVIVDNSDDPLHVAATARMCEARSWVLVSGGGNVGFGAGANRGIARAADLGASQFLILNPDAWVDLETARALAAACAAHPLEAVSPVVRLPNGTPWFSQGRIEMRRGRVRTRADHRAEGVPWLTGTVLMVSRELWERVGGFDERFFMYWEDVDLSWRIQSAGGRVRVVPELMAHHAVGGTQGGVHKSPLFVYYNCRNRLMFAGLHLSGSERLGWLLGTPRLTWELIRLGGRRPSTVWAGLRGVAAGLPWLGSRGRRGRGAAG